MSGQDDRGVSTLVGAILLFGIILVVYATWQAQVVPAENKQIEFNAFQQAGTDLAHLRNAIHRTGTTGVASSTVVKTGTHYPARVIFLNPPPASGTLSTSKRMTVTLRNVTATDGQARDYWNGTHTLHTRTVTFTPDYNQFRANPIAVESSGVVALQGDSQNVVEADQLLVNRNRITLVTVNGSYRDGGASVTTRVDPVSTATEATSVRNKSGGTFSISVPTTLSNHTWRHDVLHDQMASRGGTVQSVSVSQVNGHRVAKITFEPGVYQLRLARVHLGNGAGAAAKSYTTPARYLTTPNPNPGPVTNGTSTRLTAVVRDEYGNPTSGESVAFESNDTNVTVGNPHGGSCSAVKSKSWNKTVRVNVDANGRAVACLKPTGNFFGNIANATAHVTSIPSGNANGTASFNVTVAN